MLKKSLIFIFALVFISATKLALSQDTSIVNYFPTSIGNVWIYECAAGGPYCMCSKRYKTKIVSSVIRNTKTYYVFQTTNYVVNCVYGWCLEFFGSSDTLRIDPVSGNILRYSSIGCSYSPNEMLFDSLRSKKNDTARISCGTNPYNCVDTSVTSLLGSNRSTKSFGIMFVDSYWSKTYAYGIGAVGTNEGGQACNAHMSILGCVINGILLGDTSFLVGLKPISTEIPTDFSLYQNYPNPFNPATKIKFDIPNVKRETSNVKPVVYDALGKEVAILVNEQLKPGIYEVDWDGTNFPSGVYFYKLESGNPSTSSGRSFIQTKKMVLIK